VVFTCHRAITVFSALFGVMFLLVLGGLFSMLRQLKYVEPQSLSHAFGSRPSCDAVVPTVEGLEEGLLANGGLPASSR